MYRVRKPLTMTIVPLVVLCISWVHNCNPIAQNLQVLSGEWSSSVTIVNDVDSERVNSKWSREILGRRHVIPVISEAVSAYEYDPASSKLTILFLSGSIYEYFDVPQDFADEFNAPHPWHRVNQRIRRYRYQHVNG